MTWLFHVYEVVLRAMLDRGTEQFDMETRQRAVEKAVEYVCRVATSLTTQNVVNTTVAHALQLAPGVLHILRAAAQWHQLVCCTLGLSGPWIRTRGLSMFSCCCCFFAVDR